MAASSSVIVVFYGCVKDISECSSSRYNLMGKACEKVLPLWKRMMSEVMEESNVARPVSY